MHIAGINWAAVLVGAAAFFAIGFVIHERLQIPRPVSVHERAGLL